MKLPDIFGFRKRRELLEELNSRIFILEMKQEQGFKEVGIVMEYYDDRIFSANNKVKPIQVKAAEKKERNK